MVGGITSGENKPADLKKPYVEILETGTGWLRVREEPSGFEDNEVAKVNVGDFFAMTDRSKNNQWVKIVYQTGKEGWVSARYVRVVE